MSKRVDARELPWEPYGEAPGMVTRTLDRMAAREVSWRVNRIPVEGVAEHTHPRIHVMFVLSGRGRIWTADSGELALHPGVFVVVDANVAHRIERDGDDLEILVTGVER